MVEIAELQHLLGPEPEPDKPVVVLMCGVAGAGKTTFSQKIAETLGYTRLSIDEEVWSVNGRYGIDYPVEQYREHLNEAHRRLHRKIAECIQEKQHAVVDSSFWRKSERDNYKRLVEKAGGQWKLLYLKVHPDELRRRLKVRSERFDANAAFTITDELLTTFLQGFEEPRGEGEIVIGN